MGVGWRWEWARSLYHYSQLPISLPLLSLVSYRAPSLASSRQPRSTLSRALGSLSLGAVLILISQID